MTQPVDHATAMFFAFAIFVLIVASLTESKLPTPPVFPSSSHYPSICYLPPESGLCNPKSDIIPPKQRSFINLKRSARDESSPESLGTGSQELLTRYYFDVNTEQCYPFGAQNCGGNENRFETKAECMATCRFSDS